MILGCHGRIPDPAATYRRDEYEASERGLVEAARACGVEEAFRKAHEGREDLALMLRVVMEPMFLMTVLGGRQRPGRIPTVAEPFLSELDLAAFDHALERRSRLVAEINAELKAMHMAVDEEYERAFAVAPPEPAGGPTRVRWPDGSPRCVFHANTTGARFDQFRPLSHFGSAVCVSRHADKVARYGRDNLPVQVFAAYLDIQSPLRVKDGGGMSSLWLVDAAREAGALSAAEAEAVLGVPDASDRVRCMREGHGLEAVESLLGAALRSKGYDGIVYANEVEGGGDSWVILDPAQVVVARTWTYMPAPDGVGLVLDEDEAHAPGFGF